MLSLLLPVYTAQKSVVDQYKLILIRNESFQLRIIYVVHKWMVAFIIIFETGYFESNPSISSSTQSAQTVACEVVRNAVS